MSQTEEDSNSSSSPSPSSHEPDCSSHTNETKQARIKRYAPTPWQLDEDEALLVGIQVWGRLDLARIATIISERDEQAVKERIRTLFKWKILSNPNDSSLESSPSVPKLSNAAKTRLLNDFLRRRSLASSLTAQQRDHYEVEQSDRVAQLMDDALIVTREDVEEAQRGKQNDQKTATKAKEGRRSSKRRRRMFHRVRRGEQQSRDESGSEAGSSSAPTSLTSAPTSYPRRLVVQRFVPIPISTSTSMASTSGLQQTSRVVRLRTSGPLAKVAKVKEELPVITSRLSAIKHLANVIGAGIEEEVRESTAKIPDTLQDNQTIEYLSKKIEEDLVDLIHRSGGFLRNPGHLIQCLQDSPESSLKSLVHVSKATANLMFHYKRIIEPVLDAQAKKVFPTSGLKQQKNSNFLDIRLSNKVLEDEDYHQLKTRLLRIFLLPLLFKRCMESEDVVEERQQRRLTLQQLKATQEKSLNTGSTTFKMYDASLKKTTQLFMPVYLEPEDHLKSSFSGQPPLPPLKRAPKRRLGQSQEETPLIVYESKRNQREEPWKRNTYEVHNNVVFNESMTSNEKLISLTEQHTSMRMQPKVGMDSGELSYWPPDPQPSSSTSISNVQELRTSVQQPSTASGMTLKELLANKSTIRKTKTPAQKRQRTNFAELIEQERRQREFRSQF